MTQENRKPLRKFKLETHSDVIHYLSETIRGLRRLRVTDETLDPIRINRAKTLVYSLSKLADLMATDGLPRVSDEALRAEVKRRHEIELGRFTVAAEQPAADTEAH